MSVNNFKPFDMIACLSLGITYEKAIYLFLQNLLAPREPQLSWLPLTGVKHLR
jgi:hypothetical protein